MAEELGRLADVDPPCQQLGGGEVPEGAQVDVNHSQLFAHPVNGRGGAVGVDRQAGVGEGGGHEAVGRQLDPGGPGLADVHYGRAELVEVPGRQVPEGDVAQGREDDCLGRPPRLVEGLRCPAPGLGVGEPLLHQGADRRRGTRGLDGGHLVPEVVQRLAGLGLVLRLHGPGHLAAMAGRRVGPDEDPETVAAFVEPLDRSCTLGPTPLTDPGLFLSDHEGTMGRMWAEAARRGARAAESDSLLMS